MPKITELTNYTTPNLGNDVLPIVDVANNVTKKITPQNLLNQMVNQSVRSDASPTFGTVKLTNLSNGYIPKHTSDSTGLEDSPIYTDGTNVSIGPASPAAKLSASISDASTWFTNPVLALQNTAIYGGVGIRAYLGENTAVEYFTFSGAVATCTGIFPTTMTSDTPSRDQGGIGWYGTGDSDLSRFCIFTAPRGTGQPVSERFVVTCNGNVGIGKTNPAYQLELSTDSAAKPSTNTWTVTSDERLKTDIQLADLNRCLEIVKSLPLKYFRWRDDIYSSKAAKDRGMLGWIATDVEQVFPKAVDIIPKYTGDVEIDDGVEEYEEHDYTIETIEREKKVIEIRDGVPVQVTITVTEEKKTFLYDEVGVVDEQGNPVLKEDGTQLTYQVPRMVKKTRPKKTKVEIENCKTVNSDQIVKVLYGAVQLLIQKVEQLEAQVAQ